MHSCRVFVVMFADTFIVVVIVIFGLINNLPPPALRKKTTPQPSARSPLFALGGKGWEIFTSVEVLKCYLFLNIIYIISTIE